MRTIVVSAVVFAIVGSTASATSEPVVRMYDVQVIGVLHTTFSLSSKPLPLDVAWSEISTWTETYKGVRLSVQTLEYLPEPALEMKIEGQGTVTGSIKYGTSGPHSQSCVWRTSRPEPGYLRLSGTPYPSSAPGARRYQLDLVTGRQRTGRQPLRPRSCAYYENPRWAKFSGVRMGPGDGTAAGWVDTRATSFNLELRAPQQAGQLGFPLDRLSSGAGFVLNLKGRTKQQSGRFVSEGSARITFVPRPS